MTNRMKLVVALILAASLAGCTAGDPLRYPPHRWVRDMDTAPNPKPARHKWYPERDRSKQAIVGEMDQMMSYASVLTRRMDMASVGDKIEALDTNNFDEAADSTWFTNRAGRFDLTADEVVAGDGDVPGPDLSKPVEMLNVWMGLPLPFAHVKDSSGAMFLVKFDPPSKPWRQTGSQFIAERLLRAAGYNAPQSFVAEKFDTSMLGMGDNVSIPDRYGDLRPFTLEDLAMFRAKISPDGMPVRAVFIRVPKGEVLGPIVFEGKPHNDTNDVVAHEHRRVLRGYQVFSAWIDNADAGWLDTIETFIPTDGPKSGYMTHGLLDLSSSLGNGSWLEADDVKFVPDRWQPTYANGAFLYMTTKDAFWAAKIMMRIPDDAIRKVAAAAFKKDAATAGRIADRLISRKNAIAYTYFSRIAPLDDFDISMDGDSANFTFDDLAVRYGFVGPKDASYRIKLQTFKGREELMPWQDLSGPRFVIPPDVVSKLYGDRVYTVKIAAIRKGKPWPMCPVDVYIKNGKDGLVVIGIKRTYDR